MPHKISKQKIFTPIFLKAAMHHEAQKCSWEDTQKRTDGRSSYLTEDHYEDGSARRKIVRSRFYVLLCRRSL